MARNNFKSVILEVFDPRTFSSLSQQFNAKSVQKHVRKIPRFVLQVGKTACLGYCAGYTFINLVGYPASVNGKSMQPTLNPAGPSPGSGWLGMDWVWVNCWRARRYNLSRGDLLVYTSPKDPHEYLIKRLIAAEGDTITTGDRHSQPVVRIPQGHVWVEGDNWDNSVDSNMYGAVPKGLVSGVASHIIWPPSRMQMLDSTVPAMLKPSRVTRAEVKMDLSTGSWHQVWKVILHFIRN